MRFLKHCLPAFCVLMMWCSCISGTKERKDSTKAETEHIDTIQVSEAVLPAPQPEKSPMARYMDSLGLIDVAELDSSLVVKLMYTQADNFTGEVLYDDLSEAYLHPDAAYALIKAQRVLKELHPSYSLLIYDAARPMSVQKKMWNVVKGTSKYKYVSNPDNGGGLHNYGLAVDISIQDSLGQPLPMGTKVDHLGAEAHITQESELIRNGKMSETERQNRILLRKVMKEAGFRALPSEWWHFNFCSREVARQKYNVIP
ncbi:M15 family metallopeptidase [Bacteroides faecium]|uniref:D-alanyl-D-alanine dipeptidase n=1 Tax=Bacteroides faecium TaxID=2715212 RepID=A0A6H0KJA0_9BACE|nr:M15 family metallopeptidase [Bacteroides faecium]QIU93319.1 M15 family metallopeptidase [Bacteroides faecium]